MTLNPLITDAGDHGSGLERFDVVVVGAGQAGLAIGHYLKDQGLRFVIVDAAETVGSAWRARWRSLVLFTARRYDALPGLSFPGDPDGHPSRDEVVAYLDEYATTFELPVRLNSRVRSLTYSGADFLVSFDDGSIRSEQVVVATGPFQTPIVPTMAGGLDSAVHQTHSANYTTSEAVPDGEVLVVGGGNTGFQIAKELSASRRVHLSVGSRQTPLPQSILGRDLFWWLTKTGLINKTVDSRIGKRAQDRDTLIGSTSRHLKRLGVDLRPRAVSAAGRVITFADGSDVAVDAVIWATGYRPDHSWIEVPGVLRDGRVVHRRGVTEVPGLYFLGLSWQHTRGSALIGWVKDDAQFVANHIADRYQTSIPHDEPARTQTSQTNQHQFHSLEASMQHHHPPDSVATPENFPTNANGLPEAGSPQEAVLSDGDDFSLSIAPVAKRLGDQTVRMIAYNTSIPGPTLRVQQGSELNVDVSNEVDLDATVHWHGLRLDNASDGTTDTQAPMRQGEHFRYRLTFPDPGVYWYHPHIREDYGQEMGLYGNIIVEPTEPDYWPPVHRDELLTLDDVLLEDGQLAPFSRSQTSHVAMGRFGNTMLIAGQPRVELQAELGEVVRFFLTNTANTRVFNVSFSGAEMKLVGGDSGRYEKETLINEAVLAPSERVVVDVLFDTSGLIRLEHRHPGRTYTLATIQVSETPARPDLRAQFAELRTNPDMSAERERVAPFLEAQPDKILAFIAEMDMGTPEGAVVYTCPMHPDVISASEGTCPQCGMKLLASTAPVTYACPMHPEVVSADEGRCPECGMKLVAVAPVYSCPMHPEVVSDSPGRCSKCGMKLLLSTQQAAGQAESQYEDHHQHEPQAHHDDASSSAMHMDQDASHQMSQSAHDMSEHDATGGIEWEDDMVEVNRATTPANMQWKIVDRTSGAENHAIDWHFRVGDKVKVRLVNEMDSDHPMHHPFHIHGAGRFLVLSRDGIVEPNLVWKDTVLVRTGETVDILLDVTNPGVWMAHCHIAEHHESGMMFSFDVVA